MITSVSSMGRFTTVPVDVDNVNNDGFDSCAFGTSVAVGTKVVFVPSSENDVGIFNTATNTFSTVDTNLTMDSKFSEGTAVGTKVVFTPNDADVVGVYDTETDTFSAVDTSLTMDFKFSGGTAVGTKVVFSPCSADVVGILDLSPSPTPPSNDEDPNLGLIIGLTVGGAVILGGLVYYFYFARVNKVQSPITFPFQKLVF